MPTSQETYERKKTTAKDVPGSGMARKAADAIETRKAKQKQLMNELFGSKKKK